MLMEKEIFMQAAIAIDKITREYLDFVVTKRNYVSDRIMRASHINGETFTAINDAVDRTLHVMRDIEEMGTGDSSGHRVRQKRLAEIKSILHVARSHPGSAIKRLKVLPTKRILNP